MPLLSRALYFVKEIGRPSIVARLGITFLQWPTPQTKRRLTSSCPTCIKAPFHIQRETRLGGDPTELVYTASSEDSHDTSAEPLATSEEELNFQASSQVEIWRPRLAISPQLTSIAAAPSEILIGALGTTAQYYIKPKRFSQKMDLSYIAPISAGTHDRNNPRRTVNRNLALLDPKKAVQLALSQYIQHLHPLLTSPGGNGYLRSHSTALDITMLKVFNDRRVEALRAQGWDVSDLMSWTWILTAESSEKAAARLMILANRPSGTSSAVIPTFVFLLLLRRTDMTAPALRLLIIHAWDRLQGRSRTGWIKKSKSELELPVTKSLARKLGVRTAVKSTIDQPMSETTIMTMAVRLLRHCRRLWPAACVTVATMLTRHINGITKNISAPEKALPERTFSRLTFLYNRTLSLLSLPSSMNPFQSVLHQQRAQFAVLRRMSEFEPALAIDREGYRAVTRVQLAHKKTLREREWADMKAESWPPWKEDKLGMDVHKGPEYGISRAGESMRRSKEAGYAPQEWESAATILAGWDTDRSPTIQTRAQFQKPLLPRRIMVSGSFVPPDKDGDVWAARIRATRTLDEAWSCFLAYKDQKGTQSQAPHYAMFEKIYFDGQRPRESSNSENISDANGFLHILPGDGKEVLPNPEDPRISIYVRTPPPSMEEFLDRMIEDKIHPSGRFLAFLLTRAESFSAGTMCLMASSLRPRIKKVLLDQDLEKDPMTRAELESVPEYVFAAFIHFLSRFAPTCAGHSPISVADFDISSMNTSPSHHFAGGTGSPMHPLLHALRLMACRKPYYRPPWNSLLAALARPRTVVDNEFGFGGQNAQDILTWNATCDLLHSMRGASLDLDLQGFLLLCVALAKAIFASKSLILASNKPLLSPLQKFATNETSDIKAPENRTGLMLQAEHVLSHGIRHVKKIFKRIVMSDTLKEDNAESNSDKLHEWLQDHEAAASGALLPRLVEVPAPAHLHVYIRVLGLCNDYIGILDLMQWMDHFAPELKVAADEAANGSRLTRRCIVAMRVFLERCWSDGTDSAESETEGYEQDNQGAPDEIIDKVYDIIEGNEQWGGWPTDKEVDFYCQRGRFI